MKNLKLILPFAVVALAACSQRVNTIKEQQNPDTTVTAVNTDSLTAVMKIKSTINSGEPVLFGFDVQNPTTKPLRFLKWYTPFEAPMSKFLDITNAQGEEVAYKGPMAKRVMPPPADSYLEIKAGGKSFAEIDLLKVYDLKPGQQYTISYNSASVSGLKVSQQVSFRYE